MNNKRPVPSASKRFTGKSLSKRLGKAAARFIQRYRAADTSLGEAKGYRRTLDRVAAAQPQQTIRLSREESEQVIDALLNPPEPNEALRKLMKR